jgi:hypothetical protein
VQSLPQQYATCALTFSALVVQFEILSVRLCAYAHLEAVRAVRAHMPVIKTVVERLLNDETVQGGEIERMVRETPLAAVEDHEDVKRWARLIPEEVRATSVGLSRRARCVFG